MHARAQQLALPGLLAYFTLCAYMSPSATSTSERAYANGRASATSASTRALRAASSSRFCRIQASRLSSSAPEKNPVKQSHLPADMLCIKLSSQ